MQHSPSPAEGAVSSLSTGPAVRLFSFRFPRESRILKQLFIFPTEPITESSLHKLEHVRHISWLFTLLTGANQFGRFVKFHLTDWIFSVKMVYLISVLFTFFSPNKPLVEHYRLFLKANLSHAHAWRPQQFSAELVWVYTVLKTFFQICLHAQNEMFSLAKRGTLVGNVALAFMCSRVYRQGIDVLS